MALKIIAAFAGLRDVAVRFGAAVTNAILRKFQRMELAREAAIKLHSQDRRQRSRKFQRIRA
jgi:hypothetical protein